MQWLQAPAKVELSRPVRAQSAELGDGGVYVCECVSDGFNFACGAVTKLRCSLCVCAKEDRRTRVLNWMGSQPGLGMRVCLNSALSFLAFTCSQRHTVTQSHTCTPTKPIHTHYTHNLRTSNIQGLKIHNQQLILLHCACNILLSLCLLFKCIIQNGV